MPWHGLVHVTWHILLRETHPAITPTCTAMHLSAQIEFGFWNLIAMKEASSEFIKIEILIRTLGIVN
jgi:hypothetical protein